LLLLLLLRLLRLLLLLRLLWTLPVLVLGLCYILAITFGMSLLLTVIRNLCRPHRWQMLFNFLLCRRSFFGTSLHLLLLLLLLYDAGAGSVVHPGHYFRHVPAADSHTEPAQAAPAAAAFQFPTVPKVASSGRSRPALCIRGCCEWG
jgi:hypothetical protein